MRNMRGGGLAVALVAAGLLAPALAACTASEVKPNLTMAPEPRVADSSKVPETREAASAICAEKTRKTGIKSVTAIFSRLRPGKANEEFASCMREYGYETSAAGAPAAAGAPPTPGAPPAPGEAAAVPTGAPGE